MASKVFFSLLVLVTTVIQPIFAGETVVIQTEDVAVFFEEPLRRAAKKVIDIYPGLREELERTIGWRLKSRPTLLLVRDSKTFHRMGGSNLIVAFAVPEKNLIVIDHSKVNRSPFTLGTMLKHELCHLLLHRHIREAILPKWLDEGVSQWASDGVAEIIMDRKRSVLKEATLSGNYIPIREMAEGFPEDKKSLLLAYEESKSFVEFINHELGRKAVLDILNRLRDGDEVESAILAGLSLPLDELEKRWHRHLRKRTTWFTYLATNLYVILFFLAALMTIFGFIRLLMRKKRYRDEEEEGLFPS